MRKTVVSIAADKFLLNGEVTYRGKAYRGLSLEGLLLNSRMVQGIFDDENPETRKLWAYPDGTPYSPERNTAEFLAAMPVWRQHGLNSFTINLQGGSPIGYSKDQPWINSAFTWEGELKGAYLARLERILDKADELGMAVMLGYFYFGQEPRMASEDALRTATDNATDWVLSKGYTHVMVEIANECNIRYKHDIIRPERADELINRVKARSEGKVANGHGRLLVSTSLCGNAIPNEVIATHADYLLIHGNGVSDPNRIAEMVQQTRAVATYHGQPIVFNEDDHFDFDKPQNNFLAAVGAGASWGYFDYRMPKADSPTGREGYDEGYQSLPVNWGISSERKKGFFGLVAEMTGGGGAVE